MKIPDPHPWLGLDYRELLPGLALGQHRFTMSLTRPNGFCHGSGALRVISVRQHEAIWHCVLAYEHYVVGKPRRARGSGSAE